MITNMGTYENNEHGNQGHIQRVSITKSKN